MARAARDFPSSSKKVEEPGRYFHPLLATLITGAARLMLGIAECLCMEKGLDWAFCDTDSLAIAKPDNMDQSEFFERAQSICDWFSALNPYEKKGSIFKIEDANFQLGFGRREFGTGSALFLLHICEAVRAYSTSASPARSSFAKPPRMGLGNTCRLMKPRMRRIQFPRRQLDWTTLAFERWQYDLWYKIIQAALDGRPDQVDLSYHDALKQPAVSRYGATTPVLLKWFEAFNRGREYPDQVKPFNFLSAFHARPQFELPDAEQWAKPKRGRPRKQLDCQAHRGVQSEYSRGCKGRIRSRDRQASSSHRTEDLRRGIGAIPSCGLRPNS